MHVYDNTLLTNHVTGVYAHMGILFIMQGIPGSGKSTKAELLAKEHNAEICSTDSFFCQSGEYKFDPEKLGVYHNLNLQKAISLMKQGKNVIVDNTNILVWQAAPYVKAGVELGYEVRFIRCEGNWKSIHNVPDHAVERMRASMEELTLEKCLAVK